MSNGLQKRMFAEMQDKAVFEAAREAAYAYADGVRERDVYPGPEALAALAQFDEKLPQQPGDALEILRRLARFGAPASVAQTGGRYFGFVNGGVLPAALAVRWLTDFWDQNTPLYATSPVAARIETITEGWLRELFSLPRGTVAGFVSGSSLANFCALAAARKHKFERLGWDINRRGFAGAPELRIVASRGAHGTLAKAIALLGFGTDRVEWVEADEQGCIDAARVPGLDADTILVLQAGNVNSGAFDDFDTLCRRARDAGAWVHIDGAFGLWAAACQRLAHLTRGIELADSWCFDGHKTLNTPYDSGVVMCRDADALAGAMHAAGSYIVYGDDRDGMLYTPEMSRRARVFELWAALGYLGRAGLDELVDGLQRRALQFAEGLRREGFEILNDVVFNQVLAACGSDAETEATLGAIQRCGECWAGGTRWRERAAIRVSVCSWATTEDDVERSVRAFAAARAEAVRA